MADIHDIPIDDIKTFLSVNKARKAYTEESMYNIAFDLIKKNNIVFEPDSIVEWAMAYNLVEQNIDIPRYTIATIKQLSEIELLQLAQLLTMKTTNIHHIINILKYMHKLDESVKDEQPIYAVYSRQGPSKILMLLNPRLREVTYTPTGIQVLKLNKNNVPGYIFAAMVSGQYDKFLTIPYVKGRTEEEIRNLIENPVDEYNIKDIELGDIYTGIYGKVGKMEKSLKSITSCQKIQTITLSQAPKGTPWYNSFITMKNTFDEIDPGMFVLGKNEDYIITTNGVNFEKILDDIKKCGRVHYLIVITKDKMTWGETEETSHAMALVVDPEKHLLEVFDSNQLTPNTRHVYFWATKLLQYLSKHGINVQRKITADEIFCPQGVSSLASNFKGEGQCLIWSYWYIWLRINNPEVPPEAIRRYMSKMTPEEVYNRISKIATFAYGSSTDPGDYDSSALYALAGPRKIIFLYKNKTGEIVYTPYGVDYLKLNPNKLPTFVEIYPLISNFKEYVLIPYTKGRSEQEIEQAIEEKISTNKYDL